MKKVIIILLGVVALPCAGQTSKNVVKATAKGLAKPPVKITMPHTAGVRRGPAVAARTPVPPVRVPTVTAIPAGRPAAAHSQLEEQLAAQLAVQQNLLRTQQDLSFESGFGKSVLYAPLEEPGKTGGFTVTVLNIEGEMFGVIASHVLPESYYTYKESLKKDFHVTLKQADGSEVKVGAHVVQISPKSMFDISLVKFDPEAESLLSPLTLSTEPIALNERLFSYGFANGAAAQMPRNVQANSFVSVRTDQHIEGLRYGFCGSPLLDVNGQVKAIHTGTVEGKNGVADVSYGTHAKHIHLLVEAYRHQGQALYDLTIEGQRFARLNVDEYISAVYVYDANGKKLAQKNMDEKFSQSVLLKLLEQNPSAAYLQLTSRKAQWLQDDDWFILKEDRSKNDKTKRQHWYNLQTRQILPGRPEGIKM